MSLVHVVQFDPKTDPELLRTCHQIATSGWSVDHAGLPPSPFETFASNWRRSTHGHNRQTWIATDDANEPVGCCELVVPMLENVTMAICTPVVAMRHRRPGFGTAILAHCASQARKAGRSKLSASARDDAPGSAFARAHGARGGIDSVYRTLEVGPELPARLARLRPATEERAAGYETLTWEVDLT